MKSKFTIGILLCLLLGLTACSGNEDLPALTDCGIHTFTATGTEDGKKAEPRLSGKRVVSVDKVVFYTIMESDDGYRYLEPADSLYAAMIKSGSTGGKSTTSEIRVWTDEAGNRYYTDTGMSADDAAVYVISDDYGCIDDVQEK